jgi:tetratricopeptide (TPR) repeat protein
MLIPCPSCGKRISDRVALCPFCRGPSKGPGIAGTVSQSPAPAPASLDSAIEPIDGGPSKAVVVLAPPPVAPEALPAFERGDFIGDLFQVISTLGEGGFGIVYLARSLASNDIVALKTLRGELLRDAQTRAMFQKEARIWIDLGAHPNLVRAKWVDEVSGRLYIAMEYVQAGAGRPNSLEGHLEKSPIPLDKTLRWSIEFCRGMEYAMSRGIRCHRDIKPANILIGSDGVVKISDFGIAGLALVPDSGAWQGGAATPSAPHDPARTVVGTVFGTPTHMSPEQFVDAASCDERSDIYSFGVVLYQMASGGRLPFRPGPPPAAMRGQAGAYYWHAFRTLHTNATEGALDSPLAAIIARSLKKAPADRYQSFASLRADLEALSETTLGARASAGAPREETAKDWNAKGISLATLNRWAEALACYDQALAREPNVAAIHSNRGNALRNLQRPEESLAAFDQAIELDPLHAPAWENKSLLYAHARRNEEALACIERSLALDPTVADAWVIKGVMLGRLNRTAEQLAAYDGALGIDPRNVSAWFNKANTLSGTNREAALQCLDSALAADPSHASAWDLKGTILCEMGRPAEAVRCHQEAVRLAPQDARSSYNLGNAWVALGRFSEASAAYENATRLSPRTPIAWYNFALTRLRMGQHAQATPLFEQFLALDPPHDALRQGAERLLAELRAGRKPELGPISTGSRVTPEERPRIDSQPLPALQPMVSLRSAGLSQETNDKAAPPEPEVPPALPALENEDESLPPPLPSLAKLNDEAAAHFNARRLTEAMSLIDTILKIEPRDGRALNTRATTLFRMGNKDEACAAMAKAVDACPGDLPLWFNKVMIEHGAGRLTEACRSAIDLIEIAQASSTKSPQVDEARQLMAKLHAKGIVAIPRSHPGWLGLGFASMVAGRPDAALDFFDKATLASPENVETHRWKGSALKEVKRADEALAVCDRAIELAPEDPEVHHDRGVVLAMLREFDQAVASFDRALSLEPNHVASLSDKGKYAGELGLHEIALAALRRASALMPDHPAPWLNQALVADVLKRDEDALHAYEKFLERAKPEMKLQIESSRRRVEQLRARVAARKGASSPQVPAPKLAGPAPPLVLPEVTIPPRVAGPPVEECLKRSETARNQAVFDRALEFADMAVAQEPSRHQAWLAKADALLGLKRFAESAACAKKAIELQGTLAPAWVRLASALEGMNALEPAREAWEKAVEFAAPNVLNWNGLGLCLARLGRFEEALAAHDRSLAIDPRFSLGKFHKGMREADLGRPEAAKKSLQQFLALAPPALAGLIQQARKRIQELKA